jgi:hypothetical protein
LLLWLRYQLVAVYFHHLLIGLREESLDGAPFIISEAALAMLTRVAMLADADRQRNA